MIDITSEYLISQGLSLSLPKRFWSKVNITDGCWIWTAYRDKDGYGTIRAKVTHEKMMAHDVSWILHFGSIPQDKPLVCHHCDNPPCVRPDHLFVGTTTDNANDMLSKGRGVLGELCWKAKLTSEQVKQIRELYAAKIHTQRALGIMFGVAEPTVNHVVTGYSWRHIPQTNPP